MIRTTALAFALMLVASAAWPQGRDVAAADALYREARAFIKKGDYTAAYPKLEESYRLDPAAGTGINLGDCYEKLGKVASALLAYKAAFGLLGASDPRVLPVKQQIAALEKRVPRLTIKLAPGAPEGTKVKRDGRWLETEKLGTPSVLNPGKHAVVVSAPGRDHRSYYPDLDEGDTRELVVEAGEPEDADSSSSEATPPTRDQTRSPASRHAGEPSSSQTPALVVGGIAVAGLSVGVVFTLKAVGKKNDRNNVSVSDTDCASPTKANAQKCDDKRSLDDDFKTFRAVGYVGFGVSAAAALLTIVLWPRGDTARVAVLPVITPGGAALTGRF